jgi:hypothetical protein
MNPIATALVALDSALPGDTVVEDITKLSDDDIAAFHKAAKQMRLVLTVDEWDRLVVADRKIEKIEVASVGVSDNEEDPEVTLIVTFDNGFRRIVDVSPIHNDYDAVFCETALNRLTEEERSEVLFEAKKAVEASR